MSTDSEDELNDEDRDKVQMNKEAENSNRWFNVWNDIMVDDDNDGENDE